MKYKDKFLICCDLFDGDNVIDGYWNGKEFTSKTKNKEQIMFHKSILEKEKLNAEIWLLKTGSALVPDNYEIQIISAEEYEEDDDN
jgi:acyl-CoA synthetase (AMP-forming)/AMP-acid ligase II